MRQVLVLGCLWIGSGLVLFLGGCQEENYVFPPDESYFAELRHDLANQVAVVPRNVRRTPAKTWAAMYLQGLDEQQKGNRDAACGQFKDLAVEPNFALQFLAVIHVLETCPLSEVQLVEIWDQVGKVMPSWLRERYSELSLQLAREKKLSIYIAKFAHELSGFQKVQQDKVDLLWEASKQFREDEDPESQTLYLQELYNIAPRLNPHPAPQDYYDTARDFEANREFKAARKLYQKIYQDRKRKIEERVMALERFKQTFRLERNMEQYRRQFWPQRKFLMAAIEERQAQRKRLLQTGCRSAGHKAPAAINLSSGVSKKAAKALAAGKKKAVAIYSAARGTKISSKVYGQTSLKVCGKLSRTAQSPVDKLDKEIAYLRDRFMDNEIYRARAYWTNNEVSLAQKILRQMQTVSFERRWHPTGTEKAIVKWYLGQIALEQGQKDQALRYYHAALNENITDEKLRDDISWTLGLGHYLNLAWKAAAKIWQDLLQKTKNAVLKERLQLWLGQSYAQLGDRDQAEQLWAQLKYDDLYGFYGISAQHKLGESFAPLKASLPKASTPWPTLEWLKRTGELSFAHRYLAEKLKKIKSASDLAQSLKLCLEIEWYDKALGIFYGAGKYKRAILEHDLALAYPAPYQAAIAPLAQKYDVPLALIYAVIRQESGLNRYAISAAHAYGLMQLTPETAQQVAKKHHLKYRNFNDLFDPRINAELGIAYLKDLLTTFKGHLIPAISSYNANMVAVKNWLKRKPQDNLLFIEMIPYQETRQYVKAVLRNMVIYQQLLGQAEFKVDESKL
ncbi:MAG: lytic transglycosylase domain-containing protein [Bacteriovoracaceae bacterium]|nr:lytic transglycosylase domain-containing protein [Bacteriovoracaceae bacterium]